MEGAGDVQNERRHEIESDFQSVMNGNLESLAHEYILKRVREITEVGGRELRKSLGIPFLRMNLPRGDYDQMLREALLCKSEFVAHGFDGNAGWKSLCLHGLGSEKTLSFDRYGYEDEISAPYGWTSIAEKSPVTRQWLEKLLSANFYRSFFRVRFMLLEPGGYVRFHRDIDESESRLGPVNIALNMPEECDLIFRKWGKIPFKPGDCMSLDVSQEHGVWNRSGLDRIHIIIHGLYGEAYYQQIEESVEKIRKGRN